MAVDVQIHRDKTAMREFPEPVIPKEEPRAVLHEKPITKTDSGIKVGDRVIHRTRKGNRQGIVMSKNELTVIIE